MGNRTNKKNIRKCIYINSPPSKIYPIRHQALVMLFVVALSDPNGEIYEDRPGILEPDLAGDVSR